MSRSYQGYIKILNEDCLANRIIQSSECSSGFGKTINVYYRKYETRRITESQT
jgi:hypothetical protein